MSGYLAVLRFRDYRLLWGGSVVSQLGDGATWIALAWLAVSDGGAGALGVLGVCYTLPVIAGGALVGPLLDRFSRRHLLVADSVLRGAIVALVPVLALTGQLRLWHLFVVAGSYGLLKIVPLGVVPAVVPELVPKERFHTASALELVATGAAGFTGPALGGVLIPLVGAPAVLAVDAVSYLVFAVCVLAMRNRLPRPEPEEVPVQAPAGAAEPVAAAPPAGRGWRPVIAMLRSDRVLLSNMVAFAMFNVAGGMVLVTLPWLVHERLPGGAVTLGLLLAIGNGAGLAGALVAGAVKPSVRQMRRVGVLQAVAGCAMLLLQVTVLPFVLLGVVLFELLTAPMSVSAQVVRLARIPATLRGRTMTIMRTVMNSAIPLGTAIAAPLLAAGLYPLVVVLMALIAAVPGFVVAAMFRTTSFADELGLRSAAAPAPAPSSASAS